MGTASSSSTASPLANDASPSTMSRSMYERSDAEEGELMDSGRPRSHAKRRKVVRLLIKQRTSFAANTTLGESRMRLANKYSNRVPRTLNMVASADGRARASASVGRRGSCNCASLLASYDPLFDLEKRTQHERALRTSSREESMSAYNYSRLRKAVIERLFDGRGNWTVHEACARDHLRVTNWWLARCHTRAFNAAQMPTKRMTKAMIAASPNVDGLISRIRRLDDCVLRALQYFRAASLSDVMDVVCFTEHGHTGAPSIRTKVDEQVKFCEFARAHRSPTGRTADKKRRFHGVSFYLDSKCVVLRNGSNDGDTQPSYSAAFDDALSCAKQTCPVCTRTCH